MILSVAVSVMSASADVAATVKIWMKRSTGIERLAERTGTILSASRLFFVGLFE